MFNSKIFSERIKYVRTELNMTQSEFCHLLHISQQSLSAYENCKMLPSLEIAQRIAIVGNVSLDWLSGLSAIDHHESEPITEAQLFDTIVNLASRHPLPNVQVNIVPNTTLDRSDSKVTIDINFDSSLGESILELRKNLELVEQNILTEEIFQIWSKNRHQKILLSNSK